MNKLYQFKFSRAVIVHAKDEFEVDEKVAELMEKIGDLMEQYTAGKLMFVDDTVDDEKVEYYGREEQFPLLFDNYWTSRG